MVTGEWISKFKCYKFSLEKYYNVYDWFRHFENKVYLDSRTSAGSATSRQLLMLSWIQIFVMTELAKPAKSFLSRCDLDLTLIDEVIERDSSNVLTGLYASFIWLRSLSISSKSDVRFPRYCKFSSGAFYINILVLHLWRKPCVNRSNVKRQHSKTAFRWRIYCMNRILNRNWNPFMLRKRFFGDFRSDVWILSNDASADEELISGSWMEIGIRSGENRYVYRAFRTEITNWSAPQCERTK